MDVEQAARQYPWFSFAHLVRFSTISSNDPGFSAVSAETSLHFPDPLQLEIMLSRVTGKEEPATSGAQLTAREEVISAREENIKSEPAPDSSQSGPEVPSTGNLEIKPAHIPAEVPLAFEPLHTTDYFASQGIKLSEEQQSADRLGKQMKSFTAWLKTMKRIHTTPEMPPEDVSVRIIAEKSNQDEEVVTESMAEVFADQGKKEKAIEIYRKLSLINPAKSAYFAQKIDLLNN